MSIDNYIERQLIRKSLGTYFRKGKWILHLIFILFFWTSYSFKLAGDPEDWTPVKLGTTAALMLPFLVFFYSYCLYLIPFCFKRNQYKKFWLLLLGALVCFPLLDFLAQLLASPYLPLLREKLQAGHTLRSLGKVYFNFTTSFIGFTALLYFMELLEGISTYRETDKNQVQLAATELHRLKTQMNPDFMIRSLDGIIRLAEKQDEQAPDSVIEFSDVLRYRLYRSRERLVPLQEELAQLSNLFQLHNALPGQENTCSLETEGDAEGAVAVPLSLINVAEPLLTTFRPEAGWSLLLYLLIEEKEIQVAAELSTPDTNLEPHFQAIRENMERLLYSGLTFTIEKDENTYSIRICIPIFRNLTASS